MKAIWKGAVIAEDAETVVVGGAHYFSADSVNKDLLTDSAKTTEGE